MKAMHRRWTSGLSLLVMLAACGAAWGQSPRAEARDPAEWAPRDAVFYFGITDVEELLADLERTSAAQMMKDPAVKSLPNMQWIHAAIETLKKRLAGMLDTPEDQLKNPFAGPLALYLSVPPGAKPDEISGALIAGVGNAELTRKYYDAVLTRMKTYAQSHETQTIEGQTVDVLVTDPDKKQAAGSSSTLDDEPDFGGFGATPFGGDTGALMTEAIDRIFSAENLPDRLTMCLTQDRLIVTDTPEQLRAVLRQERASGSLADHDDHKAMLRHLKPTGNVRLLVNIPRIIELAKADADSGEMEELRKVLRIMGAEGLGCLVGQARIGKSSFDYKFDLLMIMRGARTGIAQIISMENRPTAPPATIGADTFLYALCNLNVSKILDESERMIRQEDPAAADEFVKSQEIELPGGTKFNWRREFVDYLGGPLMITGQYARPFGAGALRVLFSLGHRDQGALVRVLGNPEITMMPLQARDVRGTQVFDVPVPMMGMIPLAVSNDRLMIGNQAGLDRAIDGASGDPLAETNQWQRLSRHVPERSWFQLYIDNNRFTEAVVDYQKNADQMPPGDVMGMFMMIIGQSMAQQLGGDLEKSEVMRKYQAPGMITIATTDEGVLMTFVQLSARED